MLEAWRYVLALFSLVVGVKTTVHQITEISEGKNESFSVTLAISPIGCSIRQNFLCVLWNTQEAEDSMDVEGSGLSPPQLGAGSGWRNRRHVTSSKSHRSTSIKQSKVIAASAGGGAADVRALAWEAASVKSHAVQVATVAADAIAAAAVVAAGNGTGTKRNRSESISGSTSLGDTINNLKRTGGSQGTRISPTSVSDIK